MGTRLSVFERRNAVQFLKTSALLLGNVLLLLVLIPIVWIRSMFVREPAKAHR
jgi:hypothetical protein